MKRKTGITLSVLGGLTLVGGLVGGHFMYKAFNPHTDVPTPVTPTPNDHTGNDSSAASIVDENVKYDKPNISLNKAMTDAANNWYTAGSKVSPLGDKMLTTTAVYDNGDECAALFHYKDANNTVRMGKVTFVTAKPTDRTFESFIPADGVWETDENGRSIELEAAQILEGKAVHTVDIYSKEMTRIAAQFITTLDPDQSHPNTMLLGVQDPVTYTDGQHAGLTGGTVYHVSKLDNGNINLVAQELLVDSAKLNAYGDLIDAKTLVEAYEQFARTLIDGKNTGMTPMQQDRFGTLSTPISWSAQVTSATNEIVTFLNATYDVYSQDGMGM